MMDGHVEPMHAFGQQQDDVSLCILSLSLLVTLACLFIKHRWVEIIEMRALKLHSCRVENKAADNEEDSVSSQVFRHTILLIFLSCSLISGLCICITRICNLWETEEVLHGDYQVSFKLKFRAKQYILGSGLLGHPAGIWPWHSVICRLYPRLWFYPAASSHSCWICRLEDEWGTGPFTSTHTFHTEDHHLMCSSTVQSGSCGWHSTKYYYFLYFER